MRNKRWQNLLEEIRGADLSGLALVPGPNLFYMTGLRMGLSERPTLCVVTVEGTVTFLMPQLEAKKGEVISNSLAEQGVNLSFDVIPFTDEEGPVGAYNKVFGPKPAGKWAFEYRNMRLLEFSLIRNALGQFAWNDAGEILTKLRMIKDEAELASIQKACSLTDLGVDVARRLLVPGVTGAEVAAEVEREVKKRGAMAAGMSLATGVDTALPHSGTSTAKVASGDLAWLDLVVCVDGYWGDITRTYAVGEISEEMKRVYRVVLEAQETARMKIRPGMSGAEVDALARDVIASYGYGDQFIHRTGHGLGLEVHEDPYVVASNTNPLPVGSVVTIEPGIYIPGKSGIRVEDDVVITDNGARSLTSYPRNLLDDETKLVV